MKKEQDTHDKLKLRKRAEDELQGEPDDISEMSEEEMRHHIQELRIHQIELDMQNEELRRTQLELEAARDKYSDLYDFAPVGYFTISAKGMILEANLTGADMLGVARGLLIGSPFFTFIKRDDRGIYHHHRWQLIETKSKQIYVMRLVKKDGFQFHVRIECTPVLDEAGNFNHVRAVVSDISDWKRAEKEKARIETHLKQAQKMEAIASLAGGVAHQFNNSLTPIIGYLDLLAMEYPDDEKINNYVEKMQNSANWMAGLTDQLLAYARGGKYQAEIMSLSDFVKETLLLIEYTLKPSVTVETDFPHDIFNVMADRTQMQMVLAAILSNASEAIEGQGRVRITCQNEIITDEKAKYFQGLKPGVYVKLQIEDDGKGMDEKTKSRIFEPFFTTKFLGRGLGMAAAYGIIKNHNGWISVDSESGQGTTVRIYLPATETKAKKPKQRKSEPVKGAGTILLIEDEEIVMNVIRSILEKLGYRVLEAKTGREAISIANTFDGHIDLAILDIVLPDMNGTAIYPLLMEVRPDLKAIVCSGYSIEGPAQYIVDAGAQGFIQKPFSMAEISEQLKAVLDGE